VKDDEVDDGEGGQADQVALVGNQGKDGRDEQVKLFLYSDRPKDQKDATGIVQLAEYIW